MPNVGNGSNTGPLGVPPGGPWFVFGATGTIQRQSNPLAAIGLASAGWVGFPTQALAKAFASHDIAATTKHAASDLPNPLTGVNAIGDFFNRLTEGNTWIRVGEVLAGVLLLYLGLNAAFRDTAGGRAVQSATGTAKNVAKRVPIPV
jgi:hypothetical protein